jgi:arginase
MGAGPDYLMDNGLPEMLRSAERPSLSFADLLPEVDPPAEVATTFELDRLVSEQVREAVAESEFPLVLSGNCNTPETTATGFTDGMASPLPWGIAGRRWPGAYPASPRWRRRTWC